MLIKKKIEKWKWSQVGILHLREGEAAACQLALHDMQLLHQKRPEKHDWNLNKLQKLEDALWETGETGDSFTVLRNDIKPKMGEIK